MYIECTITTIIDLLWIYRVQICSTQSIAQKRSVFILFYYANHNQDSQDSVNTQKEKVILFFANFCSTNVTTSEKKLSNTNIARTCPI